MTVEQHPEPDDMVEASLRRVVRAHAPDDLAEVVAARALLARADRRRRLRSLSVMATAAAVTIAAVLYAWPSRGPRPTHMLVIEEPLADRLAAPAAERDRRGAEFRAWVDQLSADGLLTGGHQLTADGGRLVAAGGVDDRSGAVPAGVTVSGFLLVRAADDQEAVQAARACPILFYGGHVSVRRLR